MNHLVSCSLKDRQLLISFNIFRFDPFRSGCHFSVTQLSCCPVTIEIHSDHSFFWLAKASFSGQRQISGNVVVVFRAAFFLCLRGAIAAAKVYPGAFCTSRDSIRRHYLDSKLAKETEPHIHTTTPLLLIHLFPFLHLRCHTLSPTSLISDSSSAYGSSFSCIIWRSDNVQSPSGTGMDQVDRNCSLSTREDSVIQSWSIVFLVSIIYCRMSLSTFVFRCFPFSGAEQLIEVKPPTQQSYWLTSGCAAERGNPWLWRCLHKGPMFSACWVQWCEELLTDPDFADLLCPGMPTHIPRKQQDELNMLKLSNVWKTMKHMEAVWSCQSLSAHIDSQRQKCCVGESKNTMKGAVRCCSLLFRVNSNIFQRIVNCREIVVSRIEDFALAISCHFPGSRKSSKMTLKVPWYSSRARFLDLLRHPIFDRESVHNSWLPGGLTPESDDCLEMTWNVVDCNGFSVFSV